MAYRRNGYQTNQSRPQWRPRAILKRTSDGNQKIVPFKNQSTKTQKESVKNETKQVQKQTIIQKPKPKPKPKVVEVEETKIEKWMTENLEQQKDEFESIGDIYTNEMIIIKEPTHYSIQIIDENDKSKQIVLDVKYPMEYPSKSPPIYSISSSFLKKISNRKQIEAKFADIWTENIGQCIMFDIISEFQEFATLLFVQSNDSNSHSIKNQEIITNIDEYIEYKFEMLSIDEQRMKLSVCPDIISCDECILDRKSIFKSYGAFVGDLDQISAFSDKLKSIKKIQRATHNMIAYRLTSAKSNGIINEFYDDDGENGGGKVILEILRKRNVADFIVMVSRWYGGTHLGSDRFRHIKSLTTAVLEQGKVGMNNVYKDKHKSKRPNKKSIGMAQQISNRLYWNEDKEIDRMSVFIGCKLKDKKLQQIMEFNLDEYGVQKNGIEWIEYISYKGVLIWDIWNLCREFDAVYQQIQSL